MNMTEAQLTRLTKDWSATAGEPIEIEEVGSDIYGFGSELGVLRLFAKYNTNGKHYCAKARVGYSKPMETWYFELLVGPA